MPFFEAADEQLTHAILIWTSTISLFLLRIFFLKLQTNIFENFPIFFLNRGLKWEAYTIITSFLSTKNFAFCVSDRPQACNGVRQWTPFFYTPNGFVT